MLFGVDELLVEIAHELFYVLPFGMFVSRTRIKNHGQPQSLRRPVNLFFFDIDEGTNESDFALVHVTYRHKGRKSAFV